MFSNATVYIMAILLVIMLAFGIYAKVDAVRLESCQAHSVILSAEISRQNQAMAALRAKNAELGRKAQAAVKAAPAIEAATRKHYKEAVIPKSCEGAMQWARNAAPSLGAW